jgi:hypothetical protein
MCSLNAVSLRRPPSCEEKKKSDRRPLSLVWSQWRFLANRSGHSKCADRSVHPALMNGKYPEKAVLERLEGAMSATLGVLAHWPHMETPARIF